MGYKTFSADTVLTSTDLMTYLMNQAVMVFSSTSARSTAVTSPTEGMLSYITGTDNLEVYDGSAWVRIANSTGWTNYTPTWTAATTNPSIGNGTLGGRYYQTGKLVTVQFRWSAGSTTTYGSGNWSFALPVTHNGAQVAGAVVSMGPIRVNRGGTLITCGPIPNTANTLQMQLHSMSGNNSTGLWDSTTPSAWASGDTMDGTFTYEAA